MRFIRNSTIILLLLCNCTSDVDVQTAEMPPPLTDVLTLEFSFGDEKTITKDEFLLARPQSINVNYKGEIFVLDEFKIKVYNNNGTPKTLIGRQGQGPGEFSNPLFSWMGPTGYLSVLEGLHTKIVSPDFGFKENFDFRNLPYYIKFIEENRFLKGSVFKILSLNENNRIVYLGVIDSEAKEPYQRKDIILYENEGTLKEINRYVSKSELRIDSIEEYAYFQGDLFLEMASDEYVIYLNTAHDRRFESPTSFYTLNIFSLKNFSSTYITHPFYPVEIPDEEKNKFKNQAGRRSDRRSVKKVLEIEDNTKFYPPLKGLLTDRHYVYAFTNQKNENGETLVDVFDIDTNEFITSAYFPIIPDDRSQRVRIQNGYLYTIKTGKDIFPEVEKYRIYPAVYGK